MMRGIVVLCLFGLLISACAGTATPQPKAATTNPEPTPIPILTTDNSVVAQGHLVPAASVGLSFGDSGWIGEVLVKEGASVKAGDTIARLANSEALDSKVAIAKLDLLNAQKQLDDLQANLPSEQSAALDNLHAAQDALFKIQGRVNALSDTANPPANEIDVARANVIVANNDLYIANYEYRSLADRPDNDVLKSQALVKFANAQDNYNIAVARLNDLLQKNLTADQEMAQAKNELATAQGRVNEAQARYDLLMKGPDPKEVEIAQAHLDSANSALLAAQNSLKQLDLVTPIDGTVVNLNMSPGQYVSSGQVLLAVADFSRWYIDTDTLVDSQLSKIFPGQSVTVASDSLKDMKINGVVESISDTYQDNQGTVTYTARIRVNSEDPRLRWGMQVVATFIPAKQ